MKTHLCQGFNAIDLALQIGDYESFLILEKVEGSAISYSCFVESVLNSRYAPLKLMLEKGFDPNTPVDV